MVSARLVFMCLESADATPPAFDIYPQLLMSPEGKLSFNLPYTVLPPFVHGISSASGFPFSDQLYLMSISVWFVIAYVSFVAFHHSV